MQTLPIRILIVEDNLNDEILLLRQLKQAQLHHQVRVISDGGVALDYLTCDLFACENLVAVFLDLNVPTVTGLELLQGIRSNDRIKHLPVIVMTSSNSVEDIKACRKLGIVSYVSKPVSFAAFTKAVADSFHNRRDSVSSQRGTPGK